MLDMPNYVVEKKAASGLGGIPGRFWELSVLARRAGTAGPGLDFPGTARATAAPAAFPAEAGDEIDTGDEDDADGEEKVIIHGRLQKSLPW